MNYNQEVLDVLERYPAGISILRLSEEVHQLNNMLVGASHIEALNNAIESLHKEFKLRKLEMVGNKTKYNPDGVFCTMYFPASTNLRITG